MVKKAEPIEVTSLVSKLFLAEFYDERRAYTDVASINIRCAGKPSTANPNGEDERWWLQHGPEMLQRWQAWRDESDWSIWTTPDDKPAIELEINVYFGDVLVRMFIDRVFRTSTGALIIVDLKSGSRTPGSDLQLGFYAAGLKAQFGITAHGGAYWMARDGACTDVVALARYTPGLLAHYVKQFQTAREHNIYLPHVTSMCRACGVQAYCLAYGGSKAHLDPDYDHAMENTDWSPEGDNKEEGSTSEPS